VIYDSNILGLEITGLSPVTAQVALIELRNAYFNQTNKDDPNSVIESVLQKDLDENLYAKAMGDIAMEYMELDIKANLGMSYLEYLKLPYFIKDELKEAILKRSEIKKKIEKEEEKKRAKQYGNIPRGK
jgi:hypothetical protein